MEAGGSVSCSQEPASDPYHEPDKSSPHLTPYFFKIHFNIILQLNILLYKYLKRKKSRLGWYEHVMQIYTDRISRTALNMKIKVKMTFQKTKNVTMTRNNRQTNTWSKTVG
jgi:hypothetical protein